MANLTIDREISFVKQIPWLGNYLASGLQKMQDAVNQLGVTTGAAAVGKTAAPSPVNGVDVKADGGSVHVTINDNNPIQKGINYFLEHSTSPTFVGAHVVHLNASRGTILTLPGMTDEGADQTHFIRAYSQYPGSDPSPPVNFGGTTPTGVLPGGNVMMTLLPSTGSGTAVANGQQQGYGLGKVLFRPGTTTSKRVSG
jgi:hypothetical protein